MTIYPILEKACRLPKETIFNQSHMSSSDAKLCPKLCLGMSFFNSDPSISPYDTINFSNYNKSDLLGKHCFSEVHAFFGISSAILVHANMTYCVRCKQQTYDDEFLVFYSFNRSKIAQYPTVVLFMPPSLMLDEHTYR